MNAKKSLENRIRGWFPQEPILKKTFQVQSVRVKADSEPKQPPLIISPWSNTSAKKVAGGVIVLWIIISSIFLSMNLNLNYPFSPAFQVSCVLAGLAVGAISGFFVTRKEVRSFSRNHQILPNTRNTTLLVICTVVIFVVFFAIFLFTKGFSAYLGLVANGLVLSVYPAILSMSTVRYFAYSAFEKRENMRLVQSWTGGGLFVIPKAPDSISSRSEFVNQDNKWKTLGIRTTYALLGPLLTAVLIYETVALSILSEIIIVGFYIGLSIYWLREAHGLDDNYRKLLFISPTATIAVAGLLFWFNIVNILGYWTISIIAVSVFALLYGLGSLAKVRTRRILKTLSVCFAIIGVISLFFSFALVYHVEDRTEVTHSQNIFSEYFRLSRQLPDEVVNISLTTQDHFSVDMTKQEGANVDPSASIQFTISDQPLSPNATIYFSANTIDSLYTQSWDAPKNGTYVLTLHFNYEAANYVWVGVTRVWSTIEMIPSDVATPLLAQYTVPTLIIASALLIGSIAIPIQQGLTKKSRNAKLYDEFASVPQS
jgi:hypothetical protein